MAPVTRTKVLLALSSVVVDRARTLAGRATAALKRPVSLQIVLRALIEEALKQERAPALLDNLARQAEAMRYSRSVARRRAARPAK